MKLKGCLISLKKFHSNLVFGLGRKKNVNESSWHHLKLSYKIIVQNGHEQVLDSKISRAEIHNQNPNRNPVKCMKILDFCRKNSWVMQNHGLLSPFYYKTGTMGWIGSTKLVLHKWLSYGTLNRVIRVKISHVNY